MLKHTLSFSLTIAICLIGLATVWAQTPTATPAPTPTVTPVVIEVRQPPQPPQSFWEKYGLITLLVSAIIGGFLTLVFQKLLGPTFAEWGEQLNAWRKGAAGRFWEQYIPALAEDHRSLKLVGVQTGEGLSPPPV